MRRRNRKQSSMAISEAELTQLTRDLDDAHHEALPSMRDSFDEWRESNADIETGITELVATPSSRRPFLLGGGALLGGAALVGSGATRPRRRGGPHGQSRRVRRGRRRAEAHRRPRGRRARGLAREPRRRPPTAPGSTRRRRARSAPCRRRSWTFATTAQGQHQDHAAAWNGVLTGAGKKAVTGVDLTVKKAVDKAFGKVKDVPGLARARARPRERRVGHLPRGDRRGEVSPASRPQRRSNRSSSSTRRS